MLFYFASAHAFNSHFYGSHFKCTCSPKVKEINTLVLHLIGLVNLPSQLGFFEGGAQWIILIHFVHFHVSSYNLNSVEAL